MMEMPLSLGQAPVRLGIEFGERQFYETLEEGYIFKSLEYGRRAIKKFDRLTLWHLLEFILKKCSCFTVTLH